ncbi:MAG: hypothetical protein WBO47_07900 [Gammaproteobacteria bacterium]
MDICHLHNVRAGLKSGPRPFGLRLSLPAGDTMSSVLGEDWQSLEWFHTDQERARRIAELRTQFAYYRKGDRATYLIEKVDRDSAAASSDTGEQHG